jgi:hypothetical protein
MNDLYQVLPKDLIYIIEDYAKDRTYYHKVLAEYGSTINYGIYAVCLTYTDLGNYFIQRDEDFFTMMARYKNMHLLFKYHVKEFIRDNK